MPLSKVIDQSPTLGCDPEFFFRFKGEVIGAEKFLPKGGLLAGAYAGKEYQTKDYEHITKSKFIIDGVQAELNPVPNYCRANLANEISKCFRTLDAEMKKAGKDITVDFSRAIEISKENLGELDEASRKFGCAPSLNVHDTSSTLDIKAVDPEQYRVRAAGGHIHIGISNGTGRIKDALTTDAARTVQMLDLLCGNTAVLVDRDETNIERRKVYGRAGEHRLPKHGLEYRTLSNFWLTSYPLMSFAFGMARLAVQLMADVKNSEVFYKEFMSKVKMKNVEDAINNNDFDMAMENFQAIEKLIMEVTSSNGRWPISGNTMKQFYHFANVVKTDGLTYWFKQDPMTHWIMLPEAHVGGFHDFLLGDVARDMAVRKAKEDEEIKRKAKTIQKGKLTIDYAA